MQARNHAGMVAAQSSGDPAAPIPADGEEAFISCISFTRASAVRSTAHPWLAGLLPNPKPGRDGATIPCGSGRGTVAHTLPGGKLGGSKRDIET